MTDGGFIWGADDAHRQGGRPRLYPFDEIEVGDMAMIPYRDHYQQNSIRAALGKYKVKSGRRFTTQSEGGNVFVTRTS